jgi:hypothetical protein
MSVQYSKDKGGIGLPSVDLIHILRDPPTSKYTRKSERVTLADVTYMIRDQDVGESRINEAISYYQKGVNPMVEVSYSNNTGRSLLAGPGSGVVIKEAKNPFAVMKDGAFRPPTFTQAQLLPLSRQKWADHAVITNPGMPDYSFAPDLFEKIDKAEVNKSYQMNYTRGAIPPTAYWRVSFPKEIYTGNTQSLLKASLYNIPVTSKISSSIDQNNKDNKSDPKNIKDVLLKQLSPNFSIIVYDAGANNYSEIKGSIKDKENIAVNTALSLPIMLQLESGQKIKLKDYRFQVVESTRGLSNIMLTIEHQPELQLGNNIPLYTITSNLSGKSDIKMENQKYDLYNKQNIGNINTNVSSNSHGTPIQMISTDKYTKPSLLEEFREYNKNEGFNNYGTSINLLESRNIPNFTNNISNKIKTQYDYGNRFN